MVITRKPPLSVAVAARNLVSKFYTKRKAHLVVVCSSVLLVFWQLVINQIKPSEPIITRHSDTVRACANSGNPFRTRLMEFQRAIRKGVQVRRSYRFCPCCGLILEDKMFSPFGANKSPDRMCPRCGSVERHRRVCALFAGAGKHYGLSTDSFLKAPYGFNHPFRLLSFGPQRQMEAEISSFPNVDHVGLDYFYPGYSYSNSTLHADVQDLSIPDGFADGIIILHVLEHIPDLPKAVSELSRVLRKKSGWALVEVPCSSSTSTKDCRLATPEERHKCAGQRDHVWRFGCEDFTMILRQHFKSCVDVTDSFAWVSEEVLENLKFDKQPLHLCRNF